MIMNSDFYLCVYCIHLFSSSLKGSTRQLDTLGSVRSSLGRARGSLLVGSIRAGQALRLAVMSLYYFRCVLSPDVELLNRPHWEGSLSWYQSARL